MRIRGKKLKVFSQNAFDDIEVQAADTVIDEDGNMYVNSFRACRLCCKPRFMKLSSNLVDIALGKSEGEVFETPSLSKRVCIDCHDKIVERNKKLNWLE